MRIVQLIDSLNVGGAEQMAVNYANALSEKVEFSGLAVTRFEGDLRHLLKVNVSYLFVEKKQTFDLKSIYRFCGFLSSNKVQVIHAHGTSYFFAVLSKMFYRDVKIVYHEHFGGRKNETFFQNIFLIFSSLLFTEIIVVNDDLKQWCKKYLLCKNIAILPNFIVQTQSENAHTFLKGVAGKRIVFLANLKSPKNHLFAVTGFFASNLWQQGWTIHLVGKIFHDDYSDAISAYLQSNKLEDFVFLYDVCNDVKNILNQADIGLLASTDEGFPVTILEYAKASLVVVVSNVGAVPKIVIEGFSGYLFDPKDQKIFINKLAIATINSIENTNIANNLTQFCFQNYNIKTVLAELLVIYNKSLQ